MERISMNYRNLRLSEYQRYILTENACSAFLEMRCVFQGTDAEIFYDTNGMKTLDQVMAGGFSGPEAILELCVDFLQAVRVCADYMISEEELSFEDRDIYFSGELALVRLRYIPHYRNEISVRERLVMIADAAMEYYGGQPGVVELMSAYKRKIYAGRYTLFDLIGITENCIRSTRRRSAVRAENPEGNPPEKQAAENGKSAGTMRKVEQGVRSKLKNFIDDLVS